MSTETIKSTRSTLSNLVQILNDGKEGFRHASEGTKNPQLKELFSRFSLQRSQFAGELEEELRNLGEKDPQDEGTSLSGKAHRVWIDLKTAVTGSDDHAILAEAERGEDAAKAAYKTALEDKDLPGPLQVIVAKQEAEVKSTHDEVKALRDAAKK